MSTDHKPLTYALASKSSQHLLRQMGHLDLISQLASDIRHVKRSHNAVADALSGADVSVAAIAGEFPPVIDF